MPLKRCKALKYLLFIDINVSLVLNDLFELVKWTNEKAIKRPTKSKETKTKGDVVQFEADARPLKDKAASSPSHAVFQVHIRMTNIKIGSKIGIVRLSVINLADIEKVSRVWDYDLKKTPALITFSLIGNCINKLAYGLKHIQYRGFDLYSHIEGLFGMQLSHLNDQALVFHDIDGSSRRHANLLISGIWMQMGLHINDI
uniref:Kinesin motor domain-containing protein n=1 Tax=Glossina austeni TaxID=7395 RepID=A0A1A9UK32_GLOAU